MSVAAVLKGFPTLLLMETMGPVAETSHWFNMAANKGFVPATISRNVRVTLIAAHAAAGNLDGFDREFRKILATSSLSENLVIAVSAATTAQHEITTRLLRCVFDRFGEDIFQKVLRAVFLVACEMNHSELYKEVAISHGHPVLFMRECFLAACGNNCIDILQEILGSLSGRLLVSDLDCVQGLQEAMRRGHTDVIEMAWPEARSGFLYFADVLCEIAYEDHLSKVYRSIHRMLGNDVDRESFCAMVLQILIINDDLGAAQNILHKCPLIINIGMMVCHLFGSHCSAEMFALVINTFKSDALNTTLLTDFGSELSSAKISKLSELMERLQDDSSACADSFHPNFL